MVFIEQKRKIENEALVRRVALVKYVVQNKHTLVTPDNGSWKMCRFTEND